MKKRIVSSVLCLAMLASMMGTTTFAAEYSTSADLTVDGLVFNLSVPTSLPISVDNAGAVTVATDSVITNNSGGMVYVSNVTLTPENDWEIVEYNTDFSKEKVNLSQFGITLNSDEVGTDGSVSLGSDWVSLSANGGKLPITYEVNVASQSTSISETISTVEFTLDWDLTDGSGGSTADPNPDTEIIYYDITFDSNGSEEIINEVSTNDNGSLNSVPTLSKYTVDNKSYTFLGWTASGVEGYVTIDTVFSSSTTLVAEWQENTLYLITFDTSERGEEYIVEAVYTNEEGKLDTIPTIPSYDTGLSYIRVLKGWTATGVSGYVTTDTVFTEDTVLVGSFGIILI